MSFFDFLTPTESFDDIVSSSVVLSSFSADIDFLRTSVVEAGDAISEHVASKKAEGVAVKTSDMPVVVQSVMRGLNIPTVGLLGKYLSDVGRMFGRRRTDIIESVLDSLPDDIEYETITVKDLGAVSLVSTIGFLADFSGDLAMLVLKSVTDKEVGSTSKSRMFVNAKLKEMNRSARQYGVVMDLFYTQFQNVIKDVTLLPVVPAYNRDSSESYLLEEETKRSLKKAKSGYLTAGFNNNPIYHLRLLFTDWTISRNEKRKETKRLLESRIVELKAAQSGDSNPKLAKQVEYYEKKVAKLDYQIKHYEDETNA